VKPFVVTSDVHLGAVPPATGDRFRGFLAHVAGTAAGLLIAGDLFEFGIAHRSVVPRAHVRVLAALTDLVESGVPVYLMAGNHDYLEWGGHVLREDVGAILLPDPTVLEIGGRRAFVTHGDWVGEGALRSRVERKLARSRPFVRALHWLHPDLTTRLQPITTSTREQVRRYRSGQGGGPKMRAPAIEQWAHTRLLDDRSLELVIAGHAHLPANVEVLPGRYYINAGDWVTHCSYVSVPESGPPQVHGWR
jgi:UDP-2,3-diacylglucosamine hydrolase